MHYIWAKQAVWFDYWLIKKDYLQTHAFLNLVMMKWEEYPHALQRKVTRKATNQK